MKVADFNGIHLFFGEPVTQTIAWIDVNNIENLYSYIKENGWDELTAIQEHPWGGKTCDVTTIDGSILRFCEMI